MLELQYWKYAGTNTRKVAAPNNRNKDVAFKNCAPFTDCISEKNTQINNAKDIAVAVHMYNLIEYSTNHSQTSGRLWLYYRDQPLSDDNGNIIDFTVNNDTSLSFKYKKNVIDRTGNDGKIC